MEIYVGQIVKSKVTKEDFKVVGITGKTIYYRQLGDHLQYRCSREDFVRMFE